MILSHKNIQTYHDKRRKSCVSVNETSKKLKKLLREVFEKNHGRYMGNRETGGNSDFNRG